MESTLRSRMKSAKHIAAMSKAQGKSWLTAVVTATEQSTTTAPLQSPGLNDACQTHELVTGAEILPTESHHIPHVPHVVSSRGVPDSEVAKACGGKQCPEGPSFLSALQWERELCEVFVALFDKSTNDCLQRVSKWMCRWGVGTPLKEVRWGTVPPFFGGTLLLMTFRRSC